MDVDERLLADYADLDDLARNEKIHGKREQGCRRFKPRKYDGLIVRSRIIPLPRCLNTERLVCISDLFFNARF